MASYGIIKEKLKSVLQSEKTINFFKNTLNNNGFGLSNATPNLNRFLTELLKSDHDVKIIEKGNRKRINNDIEIYGKKILVRTAAVNAAGGNNICFESFKYEIEDRINFTNVMNVVNNKLKYYEYIFLIRIEEEYIEDRVRACYHYYLFPTEIFKIKSVETIDFDSYKRRASLSSEYWTFRSYNSFYLKCNDDLLRTYNFCPCYINC